MPVGKWLSRGAENSHESFHDDGGRGGEVRSLCFHYSGKASSMFVFLFFSFSK